MPPQATCPVFLLAFLEICFMMLVLGITDETYRIRYNMSYL